MKTVLVLLGATIAIGVVLAVLEKRRNRPFLKHDHALDPGDSAFLRAERERATGRTDAHHGVFPGSHDHQ